MVTLSMQKFQQWLREQPRDRCYNLTKRTESCPLACFLRETTGDAYKVGYSRYWIHSAEIYNTLFLPFDARVFVQRLDSKYGRAKPTTVQVEAVLETVLSLYDTNV